MKAEKTCEKTRSEKMADETGRKTSCVSMTVATRSSASRDEPMIGSRMDRKMDARPE